jgi:hypothetical protein
MAEAAVRTGAGTDAEDADAVPAAVVAIAASTAAATVAEKPQGNDERRRTRDQRKLAANQ